MKAASRAKTLPIYHDASFLPLPLFQLILAPHDSQMSPASCNFYFFFCYDEINTGCTQRLMVCTNENCSFLLNVSRSIFFSLKYLSVLQELERFFIFFSAGKQVIHPGQVQAVQEEFSPSQERIQWAKELIAAFDQHQKEGKVMITPYFFPSLVGGSNRTNTSFQNRRFGAEKDLDERFSALRRILSFLCVHLCNSKENILYTPG